MARAGYKTGGLQKSENDDVEKSLEVLDKVLSEFEDPDSLPHIELESPSQGNQSEDDGYMSMNVRRAKACLNLQPSNECSTSSPTLGTMASGESLQIDEARSSLSSTPPATDISDPGTFNLLLPRNEQTTTVEITNNSSTETLSEDKNSEQKNNAKNIQVQTNTMQSNTTVIKLEDLNTVGEGVIVNNDNDLKTLDLKEQKEQLGNEADEINVNISENKPNDSPETIQKTNDILESDEKEETADSTDFAEQEQNLEFPSERSKLTELQHEVKLETNNTTADSNNVSELSNSSHTTLPKTRPSNAISSKYSSLPCSGPPKNSADEVSRIENTFESERNVLGMGISAVHNAVLRGGVTCLPEPILNEHPVTVYPGRTSPPRACGRLPPRTLPGSIERHREVCRNLNSSDLGFLSNALPTNMDKQSPKGGTISIDVKDYYNSSCNGLQRLAITKSPSSPTVSFQQYLLPKSFSTTVCNSATNIIDNGEYHFNNICLMSPSATSSQSSLLKKHHHHMQAEHQRAEYIDDRRKNNDIIAVNDSDDFSDDSLEGQSLPPPPPPPMVPPPPSLSAPVTPSKRGSIAWEINLDDHLPLGSNHTRAGKSGRNVNASGGGSDGRNLLATSTKTPPRDKRRSRDKPEQVEDVSPTCASAKIITRRRGRSVSGSQSSLASTPANSGGSFSNRCSPEYHSRNRSSSMEWLPEPPICSTEDEAASIYSDSDEVMPDNVGSMIGRGTFVIRKGRKERHRLSDVNVFISSSVNPRLNSEENLSRTGFNETGITVNTLPSTIAPTTLSNSVALAQNCNSLFIPNSRHSIDLGSSSSAHNISSPSGAHQSNLSSPRLRLSLDLISRYSTSELPQSSIVTNCNSTGKTSGSQVKLQQYQEHQKQHLSNYSPHFIEYSNFHNYRHELQIHESNGKGSPSDQGNCHGSRNSLNNNSNSNNNNNNNNTGLNSSLTQVASLPSIPQLPNQNDNLSTPHRELAPPIEEDEEQDSESQRGAPLRQIENNISALLRGDIPIGRAADVLQHPQRPLGFRPGVHKSESAKEMLLSQINIFGPLPPSPESSSPRAEDDEFPPLPPSPQENVGDDEVEATDAVFQELHGIRISSITRLKSDMMHYGRDINNTEYPPALPPHRGQPTLNTLKTRSMDAGYTKKYSALASPRGSGPGTLPDEFSATSSSRRRLTTGAFPKKLALSPREEKRLQTSFSLPETPIFARGCDIPRTPHRRAPEAPVCVPRNPPRNTDTTSSLGSSIVGIGSTLGGGRHSVNQTLASGEMLRLAGGPARGWYPKQRNMRPASTEHLDRLHRSQGSMRAWDSSGISGGNRKPLTLPPNLTPKFFNKSPREALRRVTSLLIRKGNGKEKDISKREKEPIPISALHHSPGSAGHNINNHSMPTHNKKKGFFKSFWKKSKHISLDQ